MPVKSDLSGLKKLQKNLEDMKGARTVPITDVLTPEFVSSHSRFPDFETLLAEAGITTMEEFAAYPDDDFDSFIAANTDFESWLDMQRHGGAAYTKRQLLKGLGR
ncbi:hypothetical protein [Pseudomonas sp. 8O]|uniref:hypothetical protein n=1 Tax=Pseudomonas sp. 8O TaxID=2653165 RepID=UPI0012EF9899|nr:hypothetical protein [Pseudomonas sp. 8O]VXB17100.1 conserved hypothetical protein [Pseudomonas sp. 8O]